MTQVFEISGMHCGGCASRAQRAVTVLAPGAVVTLDPPRLTLPEGVSLTANAVNEALATMGDYRVKAPQPNLIGAAGPISHRAAG